MLLNLPPLFFFPGMRMNTFDPFDEWISLPKKSCFFNASLTLYS